MNFRWHTRALLAIGSGAALALSFPNYNLSLLAWISLTLLVLASCGARPLESPLYGFLHGLVFYPVCLPWIDVVMQQYGNVDPWSSAGILGLMAIAGGIVCSIFSIVVAFASRRSNALACLLAPFLWVTLEFGRTHLPIIGFPWNLTGYAASGSLALVQLTTVTGVYGLTFLIAGYGSLLAYAILAGRQRVWSAVARYRFIDSNVRNLPVPDKGAVEAPHFSGGNAAFRPHENEPSNGVGFSPGKFHLYTASVEVTIVIVVTVFLILIAAGGEYFVPKAHADHVAHLVQTNFPQSEHYPSNWLELHEGEMRQLERISIDSVLNEHASLSSSNLIVWPEVPAPFSLQEPQFEQRATRIARDSQSYFLVGVVDWRIGPNKQWIASNSAVLLNPGGQRTFTYDKVHLVPFGEYVPLRQWIKFAGRLTADISDFTPGTEHRVGQLPDGKFGTFICYEAIFPDEIRRFAANGAELLINISNDGWFGRSSAPPQHLMMARVRAVENRRWLLRDTNNGYTVVVDPYGRIVASLPTDVRTELDAPYAFRSDLTVYSRFGDWFSWLCVFASAFVIATAVAVNRKRSISI